MNKNVLVEFGLSENEAKVYLGFNENPQTTAAEMARILKMDKSSTYSAVESLRSKGLLIPQGGEKGLEYLASDPEALHSLYTSKKAKLDVDKSSLDSLIKSLKNNNPTSRNTSFRLEYGLDSHVKRMEESIIDNKEKLIREIFTTHEFLNDPNYVNYVKEYANKRRERGIYIKQIEYNISEISKFFPEIMSLQKKYLKEVRIRDELLNDDNSLRIWDNTVNIVSYDESGEFIVITIKDQFVANLMKNMFDFIWSKSEVYLPKN